MTKWTVRFFIIGLCCGLFLSSSCIEEVSAPGGGNNRDTTSVFVDVSSDHLPPDSLDNNSMAAKAADLDNDGDLDLVVAVEFKPNKILINDGTGHFTDETSNRIASNSFDTQDVAVADFNLDGSPDLVFVNNLDQVNKYYLNNGNGFFTDVSSRIPVTGLSLTVLSADINNDNAPDLIIGNNGVNTALINNGRGFFSDETSLRLPQLNRTTRDFALGDIDGDGARDLLEANEDDNRLLLNTGNGNFVDRTQTRLPLRQGIEETRNINLADVNGDGTLDLFIGNVVLQQTGGSAQNRVLINNQGSFTDFTQNNLPKDNANTVAADFLDIDGDHDLDIIQGDLGSLNSNTGNFGGSNFARVLINNGAGLYNNSDINYFPENFSPKAEDFAIADFNGDGLLDIYVANLRSPDVLLFRQKK